MELCFCSEKTPTALFFKYNTQLGPPYQVLVDTNFINFSIKNKVWPLIRTPCSLLWPCSHNDKEPYRNARVAKVGACKASLQPVSQQHLTSGPYRRQLLCEAPHFPALKGASMTSHGRDVWKELSQTNAIRCYVCAESLAC